MPRRIAAAGRACGLVSGPALHLSPLRALGKKRTLLLQMLTN